MKKIFLVLLAILFIENVHALDIEDRLIETKKQILDLEKKVETNENTRLDKTYPVGTIFKTTTYSTTSQLANAMGGKWEVYGSGKTLVGINTSDSNFNTVDKTVGSSTTTLSTSNIPSHNHSIPALSGTAASNGAHTHNVYVYYGQSGYGITIPTYTHYVKSGYLGYTSTTEKTNQNFMVTRALYAASAGDHTHSVTTTASTTGSSGSGTAFTNLQPYITVYMYKRVG